MRNGLWQRKSLRTTILASIPLFCLSIPVTAQNAPAQDNSNSAVQGDRPAQFDSNTRRDLDEFNRFLDDHPQIAGQLRSNPSLLTNNDFLQAHPDLKAYLQAHPGLDRVISQNPTAFMQREDRLDQGNRRDLAEFNRFLQSHPEIAEQVRKNPSLLDNQRWVQEHPALEAYLQEHSQLRSAITSNPNAFMQAEERYDFRQDARGADQNGYTADRDANGRAYANDRDRRAAEFSDFLENHREIAEQVRRNPSLLDDRTFVHDHAALQAYLENHPEIRDEIRQNPDAFMQQEHRYYAENRVGAFDRDHVASFGAFMNEHSDIAREVSQNPDRANDQRYVDSHPELKQYLDSNPGVRQDLASNPQSFVKVAQEVNVNVNVTGTGTSTSGSVSGNGSGSTTGTTSTKDTSSTATTPAPSTKSTK
jgi:hypothetical protein